MPSEARGPVLAFDAGGPWLAAAVAGETGYETMERGQAERLMPFLEALLARAGLEWRDLGALAVGTGPGQFTGVRIAVAAARGLALGLGVPAIGISAFETTRDPAALGAHADELISLPAPQGRVQVQRFAHGRPAGAPALLDPAAPGPMPGITRVRGAEAALVAAALGALDASAAPDPAGLPLRLAAVAGWRLAQGLAGPRPAPLYVRPPDAAPPSEAPPALIG